MCSDRVGRDRPVQQDTTAARDAYTAGHDLTVSGQVMTGDHALIDARKIELATGPVPGPAEICLGARLNNLPRPPARVFAGRGTPLRLLAEALAVQGGAVVTQAVYGLGGVGKSELALHHAAAHRGDYQLVWWITAADTAQVEAALAGLAGRLCPVIAMAGTTQDAAAWAVGWLQAHTGWLLVLDNVEDPADVEPLLGQLSGGHVILTTRRDMDWQRVAVPVRLNVLDPDSAVRVITARTGHGTAADEEAAAGIATELGHLPLALDQAAAYIAQQHITPAAYLDSLRQHPARMYAAAGGGDAQRTIARLWDITITAIRDRGQIAAELLDVLACYGPDTIPRVMLGGGGPREDADEALGLLASYSMITLTAEDVSMHRLLQAVILSQPGEAAAGGLRARDTALDWLNGSSPKTQQPTWPDGRCCGPLSRMPRRLQAAIRLMMSPNRSA